MQLTLAALLALLAIASTAANPLAANPSPSPGARGVKTLSGLWVTEATSGQAPDNTETTNRPRAAASDSEIFALAGKSNPGTYAYSHLTKGWSKLAGVPPIEFGTDLLYVGGFLVSYGAESAGGTVSMYILSTVNPKGWLKVDQDATAAPKARAGHSLTVFNGIVYLMGGTDGTVYYKSVWAFDISQLVKGTTISWTKIVTDTVDGVPSARQGHSVAVYDDRMYIFGGYFSSSAVDVQYFNDLWSWQPAAGAPVAGQKGIWAPVTLDPSSPLPTARYGHVAAFLSNWRMMVFGGTAKGPSGSATTLLSDLWQYDEHSRKWTELAPVGVTPPAMGMPLGARLGQHLVLFPLNPATNNLAYYYMPYDQWKPLEPTPSSTPLPSPTPPTCVTKKGMGGLTAGITLTLLIIIGHMAFTGFRWYKDKSADPYAGAGYTSHEADE